jgi:hypothetical protein
MIYGYKRTRLPGYIGPIDCHSRGATANINRVGIDFGGVDEGMNLNSIVTLGRNTSICFWYYRIGGSPDAIFGLLAAPADYCRLSTNTTMNLRINSVSFNWTIPTLIAYVWTFVSITKDATDNIRVYTNAIESVTGALVSASHLQFNAVGRWNAAWGRNWMDEMTIFNKALSLTEIQELYNYGTPLLPSNSTVNSNLLNWWRFGDYCGDIFPTIVYDVIGANNGTLINMESTDFTLNVPGVVI